MHSSTVSNTSNVLQRVMEWMETLIGNRLQQHLGTAESDFFFERATLRAIRQSHRFTALLQNAPITDEEFIILLIALIPHLSPGFYQQLMEKFLPNGGDFPEFGGVKGTNHRGLLPTGETVLFILAGNAIEKRLLIQALLGSDGWLVKNRILTLEPVREGEPLMSGRLMVDEEAIELLTTGKVSPPRFSSDFAAEHLTTDQEWEDLVLNPGTARQIRDIQIWLQYNDTLLYEWGMHRKVKPGYRTLFYGPAGTGKTLTATLLGKYTGRDVFRIDLSLIVSKYIGETEKNMAKIFEKAQNKDWILFFDEADALFGKRTHVRDAHDKYANQEVSYLLQRVENYPGVIILASNLITNIDEAFLRRFHSVIHFPKPNAAERLSLWQKAIPPQIELAQEVDLSMIAQQYDLTGSNIINIVQRVGLEMLAKQLSTVTFEILLNNLRNEVEKEGKMI